MTEATEPVSEPAASDAPKPAVERDEAGWQELGRQVEAALLTSDRAVSAGKLVEAIEQTTPGDIKQAVEQLNALYEQTGRSFRIEPIAGGFQVITLPAYGDVLQAMKKTRSQSKLSPAALETLAIIAYKQPILRADLEAVRGVACGEVLKSLLERHLVKIVGRAEELGRPMLYGTTKQFLEVFGLSSVKDLPKPDALKEPA